MNKILLFLLLFAGMAKAQIVTIPDQAFRAKLGAIGVDTNADGMIQHSEALAVTTLNLRQANIAILDGIEAFTNLTSLDVSFNLLSTLNVAALNNLLTLDCQGNQIVLLNVTGLTNLQDLNAGHNDLPFLNVSGLTSLTKLNCNGNHLTSLDITGLNLIHLSVGNNPMTSLNAVIGVSNTLESLGLEGMQLTSLDVSAFPNLKFLSVAQNLLPSLSAITGLTSNLEELYCFSNQMTSLDASAFPNLKKLYCDNNQLTTINVSGLTSLEHLRCGPNPLTAINVTGLTALKYFDCNTTQITSLNLAGLTSIEDLRTQFNNLALDMTGLSTLKTLVCSYNQIPGVDFSEFANLEFVTIYGGTGPSVLNLTGLSTITELNCSSLALTDINLTGLTNLKTLICNDNLLTTLDLSGLTNLETLSCSNNQLTSLDLTGLNNITQLQCSGNGLTALDTTPMPALKSLYCNDNQLPSLNVTSNTALQTLQCHNNLLTAIDVSALPDLSDFLCMGNQVTALDLSNNPKLARLLANDNVLASLTLPATSLNLHTLSYSNNALPNFDFSNYTELTALYLSNTGTTSLDVSGLTKLFVLACADNAIPMVDVNNNYKMEDLGVGSTALTQLFMKNGANENFTLASSPNLQFVCTDESQTESVQNMIFSTGNTTVVVNSYCSFVPGGNYNTITGAMLFDANNNGCDANDIQQPHIKIKINDGTTIGDTFTNTTGTYSFYTLEGNFVLTPEVENPDFFNFSPTGATIAFANSDNNVANQNFCITANGVHPDVEVVIVPIGRAMPGFDAVYNVIYKNNGNQTLSGNVNFNYDDAVFDFVSASLLPDNTSTGLLTWNYTDLLPFESNSYTVTLNLNSPVETPAVQINDVLNFSATVNPVAGDENPSNNQFSWNQLVVGSFDPNAKTCLEGNVVSPEEIGNYLHYNIEFENLGTAEAIHVVVKDVIDTTMFDINSLQILYASHEMRASVRGNVVEFFFENINLAPATGNPPVGGHGNVLFKIKTLPTLAIGAQVENLANIYFDYNAPIETDMARTAFQVLSSPGVNTDPSIAIYPNPTKNFINISCTGIIGKIELFDIQGRILRAAIVNAGVAQVDISDQANGIYFMRITTEKGQKVEKIIKK